jgi:hypothetical protein
MDRSSCPSAAGSTGDEEAGEGLKPDEGDMGNRVGYSPSAETKGKRQDSKVNPAEFLASLRFGSGLAAGSARLAKQCGGGSWRLGVARSRGFGLGL